MPALDYTINSDNILKAYEDFVYKKPLVNVYFLKERNLITDDEALWYQAWEGFQFLSNLPHHNRRFAAEIRRFVFKEILHGEEILHNDKVVYQTPDGICFLDLTNDSLIERMTYALQVCYKNAKVDHDLTSKHKLTNNIPITPSHLKKFLLHGQMERRSIIRLIFALGMEFNNFQTFLGESAFIRRLSSAVPEEFVLRYGIINHMSWKDIIRLKMVAEKILEELQNSIMSDDDEDDEISFTEEIEEDELKIEENVFVEEILRPCCINAIKKFSRDNQQYSATAWKFILENSILRDVKEEMAGCICYPGYETVFLSDTIQRYDEKFHISEYGLTAVMPGRVLSQDMYCRVLTYRAMMPNPDKGKHETKLYSMEFGTLPSEIVDNILHYYEIINLPDKKHLIDRYDILVVLFYHMLMERWANSKTSFIAKSQDEAERLRQIFFNKANAILENTGYAELSNKNPLDLLLRISLLSLSPLEVYSRIYDLNIIESLINDKNFNEKKYPPAIRIWKTLDAINSTYEKLIQFGFQLDCNALVNLRVSAQKVLPR